MKDWRMAQSARTSLASLTQIQGIYREIQETLAREFRPFSRLSPENGPFSTAGVEFGTGNLIRRIRKSAGRIQAAIELKIGWPDPMRQSGGYISWRLGLQIALGWPTKPARVVPPVTAGRNVVRLDTD